MDRLAFLGIFYPHLPHLLGFDHPKTARMQISWASRQLWRCCGCHPWFFRINRGTFRKCLELRELEPLQVQHGSKLVDSPKSSFYFSRHLIVDFFLSEWGVDWGLRKSIDPNGKSGRLCSRWSTLTPPKMTLMMTATIIHTDPSTSEDQDENPERFWTALLILLPSSKLT